MTDEIEVTRRERDTARGEGYAEAVADAERIVRDHADAHRDSPAHWTWACRLVSAISALAKGGAR